MTVNYFVNRPVRAEAMAEIYVRGATYTEIGNVWGFSRERVRQILYEVLGPCQLRTAKLESSRARLITRYGGGVTPGEAKRLITKWRRDPYARAFRFWRQVADPDARGCRLWTGPRAWSGLSGAGAADGGLRYWFGRDARGYAHRLAWVLADGPEHRRAIPPGLEVCHTCDVGTCCEPSHLWLGTHSDNMHDRDAKGRGVRGRAVGMRGKHHSPEARARMSASHRARWARMTPAERRADVVGRGLIPGKH